MARFIGMVSGLLAHGTLADGDGRWGHGVLHAIHSGRRLQSYHYTPEQFGLEHGRLKNGKLFLAKP